MSNAAAIREDPGLPERGWQDEPALLRIVLEKGSVPSVAHRRDWDRWRHRVGSFAEGLCRLGGGPGEIGELLT